MVRRAINSSASPGTRPSSAHSICRGLAAIALPVVDGQVAQGRYSSTSEYVRELIRADEKRKAEAHLEAKLLEGMNGGERELTAADWRAVRKEALAKVLVRKKKR